MSVRITAADRDALLASCASGKERTGQLLEVCRRVVGELSA
jgi:hypothetical protein